MEDEVQKTQVVSEIDHFRKIQTVEEQEFNEKYANLIQESESILKNDYDMLCIQERIDEKIQAVPLNVSEIHNLKNDTKISLTVQKVKYENDLNFEEGSGYENDPLSSNLDENDTGIDLNDKIDQNKITVKQELHENIINQDVGPLSGFDDNLQIPNQNDLLIPEERTLPKYLHGLEDYLKVHGDTYFKCKICKKILRSIKGSKNHVLENCGLLKKVLTTCNQSKYSLTVTIIQIFPYTYSSYST